MAVWKREPQVDPSVVARIQAQIDADPMVQRFRAGYGSEGDPWSRGSGGKVNDPEQLRKYIAQKYSLPDGYNVSQDGQVVYGNETGPLRKIAMAALPIAGVSAIGALAGGGSAAAGGGLAADGTLGAATPIAGAHAAVPGALATGGNLSGITAGAGGAGLLAAGNEAIDQAIDRGMGGNTPTPDLGGVRPGDGNRNLLDNLGDFFTDPKNLAALGSIIPALLMSKGGGNSAGTDQAMADASRMNKITEARMRRVDPMHEAVTQLAFGRLPVSSRNGITLPRVPLPPQEG
jgi:hypothetical protein